MDHDAGLYHYNGFDDIINQYFPSDVFLMWKGGWNMAMCSLTPSWEYSPPFPDGWRHRRCYGDAHIQAAEEIARLFDDAESAGRYLKSYEIFRIFPSIYKLTLILSEKGNERTNVLYRVTAEKMNKNKRLIIIPDVHGRDFWREAVRDNPDGEFLFLGDYLDPYEFEGISEADAFRGLEDILEFKKGNPDRVTLLWGNHDLHYMYPELMGSRYDFDNAERNAHMFWDHQELFKIAHEAVAAGKRFLFSHAGVGMGWVRYNFPALQAEEVNATLLNDLVGYPAFMSALEDVSVYRGGDKRYGSMVWADIHEQSDVANQFPGVIQVFGHSLLGHPFNYEDRIYCLDCRRAFSLDYEDGRVHDYRDGTLVGPVEVEVE